MRIEVIASPDSSSNEKGDLIEELSSALLRAQDYDVKQKVRVTASELDLYCQHQVSGKKLYVECKAHRDNLSATVLTQLLGIIKFKRFDEGWLISTGPLGKDAKGFLVEWEQRPTEDRKMLSIYTPERVVKALRNAALINDPPSSEIVSFLPAEDSIGEWSLLVSPWGIFWACPCLESGVPVGVALFNSKTGSRILDEDLIGKISRSDTTLANLAFDYALEKPTNAKVESAHNRTAVVEVEFGESWTDYRPARPEHFVGRTKIQKSILQFLASVKRQGTETRVFAFKGDSGIGKSSLIAKLRDRAIKSRKPSGLFVFAVDVRAANDPGYIYASLLAALRKAAQYGFGDKSNKNLAVTDYSDPLNSESIRFFLQKCRQQKQLVVLIFDQFEELYSKPELVAVFDEARRLMISTVSANTNFVLGFAWKTDTTIPQDHPAYYMWHQLSDHRYEADLSPFTHADAENSIKLFERELQDRIRPELRRYLIENSQGYPWLLKKLCIHLYEQLQAGASQSELADRSLDIGTLFDRDLQSLTPAEDTCLKLVARNAPMDWYEVIQSTAADVVRSLQDKRLLIRPGDKLNLYWDIFREYVLTGSVPQIPFTYVPQSPSIDALLKVAIQLDPVESMTIEQLSALSGFSSKTVWNIAHDLTVFGLASAEKEGVLLDKHIDDISPENIMTQIRLSFRRHALSGLLKNHDVPPPATQEDMIRYLKQINPAAKHHSRTWRTYANRMGQWFTVTGYLKPYGNGWIFEDYGEVRREHYSRLSQIGGRKRNVVFIADAPPGRAVEALDFIKLNGPQTTNQIKSLGYRNACAVLSRFRLITRTTTQIYDLSEHHNVNKSSLEAVWMAAQREETLTQVMEILKKKPSMSASSIGHFIAEEYEMSWNYGSLIRVGNALRQWAGWLLAGQHARDIPRPPGLSQENISMKSAQSSLFDLLRKPENG